MLPTKHIYATTAISKVYHLLPGYTAWRHTYALALYAVIAAQKQVVRMGETWLWRLLYQAYLHGQFLQSA